MERKDPVWGFGGKKNWRIFNEKLVRIWGGCDDSRGKKFEKFLKKEWENFSIFYEFFGIFGGKIILT